MTEFGMSFLCHQDRVGEALTKVTSPFHSVSLDHEVTPQANKVGLPPACEAAFSRDHSQPGGP